MKRLYANFPSRFGTKFLLVLTTLVGSAIHIVASSLLQSINTVAPNLAIFYLNLLCFFLLTASLGALYRKGGVLVGVLLSLAFCSTMLWSICIWEEMYFRYVGIHLLLLLFVAYASLTISLRALADIDPSGTVNSSLPGQLMKAIRRENTKT